MISLVEWFVRLAAPVLAQVLGPIIRKAVEDALDSRAVVSKPNPDLERVWESGLRKGNYHSFGDHDGLGGPPAQGDRVGPG